ncbi:MAG: S8 family peptidase [Bacteroidales bacterium]|nr:S8 family peptidase [Bacteroidales bacterium]
MKKTHVFLRLCLILNLLFVACGLLTARTAPTEPARATLSAETKMFLAEWRSLQQKSLSVLRQEEVFTDLQQQYGLRIMTDGKTKSETLMLPVWVTFRSAEALEPGLKAAEALGFKVQTKLKTVCTGLIPVDRVEALGAVEGVRQVSAGQRGNIRMDLSRKATGVDSIQDYNVLNVPQVPSFRGEGVIVGVVDGGIEYVHPNFYDPDDAETLRIQRVWSQREKTGLPPAGYDYGVEYVGGSAIEAAEYSKDDETHGTHVTGIAAGSGAETEFQGVASKAELIVVPTTLVNEDVLDGVHYIRSHAKAEGKPCVVNLSIGAHLGPHDGTSAFDRALDEMKEPGFIVVGAAGNEGDTPLYLGYDFVPSTDDTVFYTQLNFSYPSYRVTYVDVWSHDSLPVSVQVSLLKRVEGVFGDSTGFYSTTETMENIKTLRVDEGSVTVRMVPEKNEINGKYRMMMQVDARNLNVAGMYAGYIVCMAVKTERPDKPTRVHMWANTGEFAQFQHPTLHPVVEGQRHHTVGEIGGTSNSILSVGSFNTRGAWTSVSGGKVDYGYMLPTDTLSYFSSHGPRADGRVKPDITAPGAYIVSSLNSHYNGTPSNEKVALIYKDGGSYPFGVMMGTSMASPAVTGIVALCLQVRPDWQIDSVLHYLSLTAFNDEFTGDVRMNPDNAWGRGKIDALALLTEALKGATGLSAEEVREAVEGKRMLVYPNPNDGHFHVLLPDLDREVRLQVVDRSGRVVYERPVRAAGSPVALAVPGLKRGLYVLRAADAAGLAGHAVAAESLTTKLIIR